MVWKGFGGRPNKEPPAEVMSLIIFVASVAVVLTKDCRPERDEGESWAAIPKAARKVMSRHLSDTHMAPHKGCRRSMVSSSLCADEVIPDKSARRNHAIRLWAAHNPDHWG